MTDSKHATESPNITELAILALDQLAYRVYRLSQGNLPKHYWDWIADDITPYVERSLKHTMRSLGSQEDVLGAEPQTFLAHWVHHWVMPYVRERYGLELPAPAYPVAHARPVDSPSFPDVLLYL